MSIALGMAFVAGHSRSRARHQSPRQSAQWIHSHQYLVPRDWLPGRNKSAAALACRVSKRLLASQTAVAPDQVAGLIYCHDAADERLSDSTAGRIQFELGLTRADAFSVSQCHNVSVFAALDLALGLIQGPAQADTILISASDKLLFPKQSRTDGKLVFGNTAAAVLISTTPMSAWCLLHARTSLFTCDSPRALVWDATATRAFGRRCAKVLKATLAEVNLRPSDIELSFACGANANVIGAVDAALGEGFASVMMRPKDHVAASTDPLHAIATLPMAKARTVLIWGAGNNGEIGCCVLMKQ